MRVHYRERALADLDEIFQYIDKRSPGGARNVIDAISAAVSAIAEHPLGARETSSTLRSSGGINTRSSIS
jgi:toxin ParE1/3/4